MGGGGRFGAHRRPRTARQARPPRGLITHLSLSIDLTPGAATRPQERIFLIMTTNENALTFEAIDDHILGPGFDALLTHAGEPGQATSAQRLLASYRAVQPILMAIAALPILPSQWRLALRVFIVALNELTTPEKLSAAADADFKAGKDI
jgi:hypothetical protein